MSTTNTKQFEELTLEAQKNAIMSTMDWVRVEIEKALIEEQDDNMDILEKEANNEEGNEEVSAGAQSRVFCDLADEVHACMGEIEEIYQQKSDLGIDNEAREDIRDEVQAVIKALDGFNGGWNVYIPTLKGYCEALGGRESA